MTCALGEPKAAVYIQRYACYEGAKTKAGFGRVHATRDGLSTVCGKLLKNHNWCALSEITESHQLFTTTGTCEECDEAVKNHSAVLDGSQSEGQESMSKNKNKNKSNSNSGGSSRIVYSKDSQKELLPMWNEGFGFDGQSSSRHSGTSYQGVSGKGFGNSCSHSGNSVTCELGRNITLAGAKGMDIDYDSADIVIDCAGMTRKDFESQSKSKISGTQRLVDAVVASIVHPDTLFIDWADMQVPKVGYKFWVALLEAIPENSRVVICCVGSHGRTGTAMACLIAANALATVGVGGIPDAVDIIKFVRKHHCAKAIETQGQEDYVARIVANLKSPGDKDELKRQFSLNDAAFSKYKPTQQYNSKAVGFVGSGQSKELVVASDAKQGNEQKAVVVETSVGGDEEIMFLDVHDNVVNENGDVVFEKGKLSAEEREWSRSLPTWGEYIAKRYEKGSASA